MSANTVNVSYEDLESAVSNICRSRLSPGFVFKREQLNLMFHFLNGHDCLGILPCNFGKSIIYQLSPLVAAKLNAIGNDNFPSDPAVIVVSPINALIEDQLASCARLNVDSCKMVSKVSDEVLSSAMLFYSSPEWLLSEDGKSVLLSPRFRSRVVGIVIDEAHCVVKWGTVQGTDSRNEAFRKEFAELGRLRAFFGKPFLCLTATANKKTRTAISKLLKLRTPKLERVSPDLHNVKLIVMPLHRDVHKYHFLDGIINALLRKESVEKHVCYCTSLVECGEMFDHMEGYLSSVYSRENLPVAMYHGKTLPHIQQKVLKEFVSTQSNVRFVIATCALGMGINIPDIRHVIHFGIPIDTEEYTQEFGRAGRDQKPCTSTLYFQSVGHRCKDEVLLGYVRNKTVCRRKLLLKQFKKNVTPECSSSSSCCDICDSVKNMLPSTKPAQPNIGNCVTRHVTSADRKLFENMLRKHNDSARTENSLALDNITNVFPEASIRKLTASCEFLFTRCQIQNDFNIPDYLSFCVIELLSDIFQDIDASEMDLSRDGSTFQCSPNLSTDVHLPIQHEQSSDSSMSDEELANLFE